MTPATSKASSTGVWPVTRWELWDRAERLDIAERSQTDLVRFIEKAS